MFAVRHQSKIMLPAFARFASTSAGAHHRFLVVGGGTAGVTVAAQLQRAFKAEGRPLNEADIAIIDPAETHHCELKLTVESSLELFCCKSEP